MRAVEGGRDIVLFPIEERMVFILSYRQVRRNVLSSQISIWTRRRR
jgi:hypothetical protein